jgi:hypothetical protein
LTFNRSNLWITTVNPTNWWATNIQTTGTNLSIYVSNNVLYVDITNVPSSISTNGLATTNYVNQATNDAVVLMNLNLGVASNNLATLIAANNTALNIVSNASRNGSNYFDVAKLSATNGFGNNWTNFGALTLGTNGELSQAVGSALSIRHLLPLNSNTNVLELKETDGTLLASFGSRTNSTGGRGWLSLFNPYNEGTGSGIRFIATNKFGLFQLDNTGNMVFRNHTNSSSAAMYFDYAAGGINYRNSSLTTTWTINTSSFLVPGADATYDIGTASTRPRRLYISDGITNGGNLTVGGFITGNGSGVTNIPGYVLSQLGQVSGAYVASTVYYPMDFLVAANKDYTNVTVAIPRSGNLRWWSIRVRQNGTLASSETVNHYLRVNDTTDVGQIDLTYNVTNAFGKVYLNQAITTNDVIAVKVSTPAWSVAPSAVRFSASFYIE